MTHFLSLLAFAKVDSTSDEKIINFIRLMDFEQKVIFVWHFLVAAGQRSEPNEANFDSIFCSVDDYNIS